MPSSPATALAERLLHCSPTRIVFERTDAGTGTRTVGKVYVAGSLADAEREFALGRLAAGDGVVTYLAAGLDPATSRPCVTTRWEQGTDLDRVVAEQGALAAATACELLAPVAATLARLHALRHVSGTGLCHGDVKPKNLLRAADTTLLLDFEHAHPFGPRTTDGAAFGTHGFAAPEACGEAPAGGALDVFALGRTLAWLLAGGARRGPPLHRDVEALIAACTAEQASARPDAASVARRLRELAAQLAADDGEARLDDWATASFRLTAPAPADTHDARSTWWLKRRLLLGKYPQLLVRPDAVPTEPAILVAALASASCVLRRFPRHQAALRWRKDLLRASGQLLAAAAQHVTTQIKAETFATAAQWLVATERLARIAMGLPGGCPIPHHETPATASLLLRDPLAFLQRLGEQLAAAHTELQEQCERVLAAERRLDLRAAEAAVDGMATSHGGSSPAAARQRDQLHRLSFYLDRVARAEPNVERVVPLWDAAALQPLSSLVAAAATATGRPSRGEAHTGAVGLRSLQLTLVNLAEEFPHLDQVGPALEALTLALAHVTDQAWQLLAEARQRLQVIPVPVRPLQLSLGRLDTFRILEAFVDRPERLRSQLLDGIEALRLALEQARATRDRLAESAENALARGHWTTGLFDMERAVAGLAPGDEQERAEATRLQQRLTEARQRKQEVEATVRRNVDLASLYGTLQDDPSSTFASRLQVLEERRDCLTFLTMHVTHERTVLYHRDLRDIETQIAMERAGLAEHQLDGTVDPHARLQLARTTVEQLSASLTQSEQGLDPPGRVVRVVEHWRTVMEHCQRAVDQVHAEQRTRARQRRRVLAITIAAIVVTTTAVVIAVKPWLQGEPALAAPK